MKEKYIMAGCVLPPHSGRCIYREPRRGHYHYNRIFKGVGKEELTWRKAHPKAVVK